LASGSSGRVASISLIQAGSRLQRQQVRVGEVAVVVRLFLRAHRAGLALHGVEQAGLLVDLAAVLEDLDLAAASYSMACWMKRNELTFLISQRVPRC
jgi:hypothetical protein